MWFEYEIQIIASQFEYGISSLHNTDTTTRTHGHPVLEIFNFQCETSSKFGQQSESKAVNRFGDSLRFSNLNIHIRLDTTILSKEQHRVKGHQQFFEKLKVAVQAMSTATPKRARLVSIDESSASKLSKTEHQAPMTALDSLSKITVVVADTGEFEAIKKYTPQDATTNPSLILKAALLPEYQFLVDDAVRYGVASHSTCLQDTIDTAMDKLAVNFGKKIAENVPGFVSTEVDARLSFDTDGTVARARRIISMVRESPLFLPAC